MRDRPTGGSPETVRSRILSDAREEFLSRPFDYCDVFGKVLPDEFKQHAERVAYRDGLNGTAQADFHVFLERLVQQRGVVHARRVLVGLPTGLKKLDDATSGLSGITYLAGPKGVGKTMLMLSAIRSTLRQCSDVAVVVLSFDEPKDRQYQRLLCIEAGCSLRQLLTPGEEAQRVVVRATRDLSSSIARLRIVERRVRYSVPSEYTDEPRRNLGYDLQSLWSEWQTVERWSQAKHCLICIDLIQKWPYPDNVNPGADADHWRLDILDQIRQMSCGRSRPDGFSILVLSEIRKDTASQLTIDDLKGDGRIASDADCVLLMYPADDRHHAGSHEIPLTIRIARGAMESNGWIFRSGSTSARTVSATTSKRRHAQGATTSVAGTLLSAVSIPWRRDGPGSSRDLRWRPQAVGHSFSRTQVALTSCCWPGGCTGCLSRTPSGGIRRHPLVWSPRRPQLVRGSSPRSGLGVRPVLSESTRPATP